MRSLIWLKRAVKSYEIVDSPFREWVGRLFPNHDGNVGISQCNRISVSAKRHLQLNTNSKDTVYIKNMA